MNIEQQAALSPKEFCRDCNKFATWEDCHRCLKPICDECQFTYEDKTLCHGCYTSYIADDGHIDDCPAWCGEPCNCWVSKEEM